MEKSYTYHSDSAKAWGNLYHRLESDGLLDEQMAGAGHRRFASALKIAAAIAVILAIGIPSVYFGVIRNETGLFSQQHNAEKGVSSVDLPDGSRVFLNQGAEISYADGFEQGREVQLKGEAFFEVMSDPANPFTVHSGHVVISVLGTSFNVKGTEPADDVEVWVESGMVRVAMKKTGEFITLEPGDIGRAGAGGLASSEQSDPNYISWKTKNFKFVDEALDHVLRELEESYHVMIHSDDLLLEGLRISSTYREQSIDAILETIGTAFGLSVSKKENHYYLKQ